MAENKKVQPELDTEIATRSKDPYETSYMGVLTPNDPVLLEKGGPFDWKIYRDLRRDGKVFGGLQKRTNALIGRPWQVVPLKDDAAGQAAAAALTDVLQGVMFDQLCRELMDALLVGFSVVEVIWTVRDNLVVPKRFAKRAQRRFRFVDLEDQQPPALRMVTAQDMLKGVELPERKFLVHRVNPDDDNPYGTGLGSQLYWPVLFKRKGVIAWNKLNDRFGAPTPWGKYPKGATQKEKDTLFAALKAISNDGVVMTPEGMAIDLLESKLSGSVSSQESLCNYMDDWIAEVILGQEPRSSGGGALAAASAERESVRLDLVQADSDLLSDTLNTTLIPWLCEFNGWPPLALHRQIKAAEDLQAASETDKNVSEMGFRPTLERVVERYGSGWEVDPSRTQPTPPSGSRSPAFAEGTPAPDQVALDAAVQALDPQKLAEAAQQILQPLLDAVEAASSFEDALARIEQAFPQVPVDKLQGMLADAMFSASMSGRVNGERS